MAHSATTDGPYFEGTGEIKFSQLRSTFKPSSSGTISASELLRKTDRTIKSPVVPDCTENSAVAQYEISNDIITSQDWKVSQMRGTIRRYYITQSGNNQDVVGPSLGWNSNLEKNIPKYYHIEGNITSSTYNHTALTFRRDNITNLTVYVEWTGSVKGSGGKGGGTWYDQNGVLQNIGSDGGRAIEFNSEGGENNVIDLLENPSLAIAGGGGGGGKGGKGGDGIPGPCWKPRISTISGDYTGTEYNPGPWGEWYSYKIGGGCQCEWYAKCPDPSTDSTRNRPITISTTTYNTRVRNASGGFTGSGMLSDGTYRSHSSRGGCSCNWFWCSRTCIDGAYCAVEDPFIAPGGLGGNGGNGGNGIGNSQSRTDGVPGTIGESGNCPDTSSEGGRGGTGGDGGDWGQGGDAGEKDLLALDYWYYNPACIAWRITNSAGTEITNSIIKKGTWIAIGEPSLTDNGWTTFMRTYGIYITKPADDQVDPYMDTEQTHIATFTVTTDDTFTFRIEGDNTSRTKVYKDNGHVIIDEINNYVLGRTNESINAFLGAGTYNIETTIKNVGRSSGGFDGGRGGMAIEGTGYTVIGINANNLKGEY